MSEKIFEKKMPQKKFSHAFTTGTLPKTQRVLVESIPIQEYFGNDAKVFYDEQKMRGNVEILVNTRTFNQKGKIMSFEHVFQSDGLSTSDRPAEWEDVIEVYATYVEDIEYDVTMAQDRDKFYRLDLNPMPGHSYTAAHEQGFKYIPVERQFSNALELGERQALELGAQPIYLYLIPKEIRNAQTGEVINGTQRDRTVFHTDQYNYFNPNHPDYNHGLFLLAELMNQNPMHLEEDVIYLDTRTRGGGIKKDVSRKEIESVDVSSLYNWDIGYFDGQAYQENGVIVVEVDANHFKEMTNEEVIAEKEKIERAVEKYKAFGVLPFIEFNQESEVELGELLPNGEFEGGKPCGYFSEALSQGSWDIVYKELGAGDNYVVRLIDEATFGIRIPGFRFSSDEMYQFEVKGMKDPNVITLTRSAGKITVKYEDGSEDVHRMGEFTQSYWLSVHTDFRIHSEKKLKEVVIEINDEGRRNGTMYYDYVSLVSLGNITADQEIVEL